MRPLTIAAAAYAVIILLIVALSLAELKSRSAMVDPILIDGALFVAPAGQPTRARASSGAPAAAPPPTPVTMVCNPTLPARVRADRDSKRIA